MSLAVFYGSGSTAEEGYRKILINLAKDLPDIEVKEVLRLCSVSQGPKKKAFLICK